MSTQDQYQVARSSVDVERMYVIMIYEFDLQSSYSETLASKVPSQAELKSRYII